MLVLNFSTELLTIYYFVFLDLKYELDLMKARAREDVRILIKVHIKVGFIIKVSKKKRCVRKMIVI